MLSSFKIDNAFDSHVHWLATGGHGRRLRLDHLESPEQVNELKIESHHFLGEWLVGFGWNQNLWPGQDFPRRQTLDKCFPNHPVAFSRADGHASWLNSAALRKIGLLTENDEASEIPEIPGGKIVVDENGIPTGVLIDLARSLLEGHLPPPSAAQVRAELLQGAQTFNRAGITHIRDLTCDERQWNEACHLAESGLLTLAVEQFFSADDPNDFDRALQLALRARTTHPQRLRPQGLKIFLDGALGSEGAWLSQPYASGSGHGLVLLKDQELKELMRSTWEHDFDFALHTIGDEAAHRAVTIAVGLWESGVDGRLHLEHAEIMRPETINLIKGRNVVCHMQPCHWLSDKLWLKEKVGDLFQFAFPWKALQEAEVEFHFGSDSPIEEPGFNTTFAALEDSARHGIPALNGSAMGYLSHSDPLWTPNTYTLFEDGKVSQVIFEGRHLI